MRVGLVPELGGIDSVQLRELPDPTPGAGQALVRIRAVGLGIWDVGLISGGHMRPPLPYIPGNEVAGVVEAVGDGVDAQPGDGVYASLGLAGRGGSPSTCWRPRSAWRACPPR
jgi:NADPH2:quinone reductase